MMSITPSASVEMLSYSSENSIIEQKINKVNEWDLICQRTYATAREHIHDARVENYSYQFFSLVGVLVALTTSFMLVITQDEFDKPMASRSQKNFILLGFSSASFAVGLGLIVTLIWLRIKGHYMEKCSQELGDLTRTMANEQTKFLLFDFIVGKKNLVNHSNKNISLTCFELIDLHREFTKTREVNPV